MPLHIEDEQADTLAKALAALTGESLEGAVVGALRERLAREQALRPQPADKAPLADRLGAIGARYRALPTHDPRPAEAMLYDAAGLPKRREG